MSLFTYRVEAERLLTAPLADRMRPKTLEEYEGQQAILGEGTLLRRAIEDDHIPSMILWGPPGSGKTTLAKVLASTSNSHFVASSAVTSGVKDVRAIVGQARERLAMKEVKTILFVDEIHRFNKAQQDAFLPHIEDGTIVLVGATTENPSFEVNSALISRARVFVLEPLSFEAITNIVIRALEDKACGLGDFDLSIEDEALQYLAEASNGDARRVLNALEASANAVGEGGKITAEVVAQALTSAQTLYDKDGEHHFNLISALHKSLRDSDPQAALYWCGRMLYGGEDPMYIIRRLVRFASEDIGLADPQALVQALAAKDTVHFVGMPEADNAIAQAVVYLATAPKSNSLYKACKAVKKTVHGKPAYPVPMHIRNAPTKLMKNLGYGDGYEYAHDQQDGITAQVDLPPELEGTEFYRPGPFGFEKDVKKRIDYWEKRKNRLRKKLKKKD